MQQTPVNGGVLAVTLAGKRAADTSKRRSTGRHASRETHSRQQLWSTGRHAGRESHNCMFNVICTAAGSGRKRRRVRQGQRNEDGSKRRHVKTGKHRAGHAYCERLRKGCNRSAPARVVIPADVLGSLPLSIVWMTKDEARRVHGPEGIKSMAMLACVSRGNRDNLARPVKSL